MATNPYSGGPLADSWQTGFLLGFFSPDADDTPPSPLTAEQQTVYREGALAGRNTIASARGLTLPPADPDDRGKIGEIAEVFVEGADFAHVLSEIGKVSVGELLGPALVISFVATGIYGPEQVPTVDEAAAAALNRLRAALSQAGAPETFELFVAVSDTSDGSPGNDALTEHGWWHGTVYSSFDPAHAEAVAHGSPDNTRVLRLQSVAPDTIDVLPVGSDT